MAGDATETDISATVRGRPAHLLGSAGTSTSVDVGTDADVGLDVKHGITSGLTWDFTVNTDFSQVEADEQQVNLTPVSRTAAAARSA